MGLYLQCVRLNIRIIIILFKMEDSSIYISQWLVRFESKTKDMNNSNIFKNRTTHICVGLFILTHVFMSFWFLGDEYMLPPTF